MASQAHQRCSHHEEHLHPHVVLCTWRRQIDRRHGCKGPIHDILSPTFKFKYNNLDNIAHLLLNDDDNTHQWVLLTNLSLNLKIFQTTPRHHNPNPTRVKRFMRLFCGQKMYSQGLFKPGSKEFTQPILSLLPYVIKDMARQLPSQEKKFSMETSSKTIIQSSRYYYVTGHGQWHSWMLISTKSTRYCKTRKKNMAMGRNS